MTSTVTSYSSAAIGCASSAGFLPGSIAGGAGGNGDKDLEKRTQTKAPYTTPPALSGQPSASISSLCSCLHVNVRTKTARTTIGKSTVTVTKTVGPVGSMMYVRVAKKTMLSDTDVSCVELRRRMPLSITRLRRRIQPKSKPSLSHMFSPFLRNSMGSTGMHIRTTMISPQARQTLIRKLLIRTITRILEW